VPPAEVCRLAWCSGHTRRAARGSLSSGGKWNWLRRWPVLRHAIDGVRVAGDPVSELKYQRDEETIALNVEATRADHFRS
jgi:hypothetical protein